MGQTVRRDLAYWRQRILDALLTSIALLAIVAYVPSAVLSYRNGVWSVLIVDTIAYVVVVAAAVTRGWSYTARAVVLLLVMYGLSIVLAAVLGPFGAGELYLWALPLFAACLLGTRGAAVSLALSTATAVAIGRAIAEGRMAWTGSPSQGLQVFVVTSANALFLSTALSISIAVLLGGLEHSAESLRREMDERQRAEAERERLEQHLRQTQKLEAIGTLAGGIAHDVNNLLMPIFSYTEELLDSTPAGSRQWQRIHVIHRAAERARDLVRRILAFSRPTPPAPRTPVSVADIVRETGRLLRVSVPSNVHVEWDVEDDDAIVVADASEIHQLLMNVGTNAYHAMRDEGGTLTINVSRATPDTICIRVTDTGVGMDDETVRRAFDPFFTTRAPGEGTGLGLSTVHRIVSSLGGRVHLDSAPGAGTIVEILLPAAPAYVTAGAERRPGMAATVDRLTILLVEDDRDVLEAVQSMLMGLGHEVLSAASATEALEIYDRPGHRIDVIVTDQMMPGMTGVDLAAEIRQRSASVPIVLLTGFGDTDVESRAAGLGIERILVKPCSRGELATALSAVRRRDA